MSYQLDIEKIYEYFEEGKIQEIAPLVEECYSSSYTFIDSMAQTWNENVHFYEGDQHIYYNDTSKQYEVVPKTKFNDFIPRPVTNHIFPILTTMVSLLTKNRPQAAVRENSDRDVDINRAKLGDAVLDTKWEMDDEAMNVLLAAKVGLTVGTVYRKDYWDTSGLSEVEGEIDDGEEVKKDENGEETKVKKTKKVSAPLGDNAVAIRTPYEVIPDLTQVNNIDKGTHVMEATVQSLEWIKANYEKQGEGFTDAAKDVKESEGLSPLLSYVERLKGSTGKSGQTGQRPEMKNRAVHIEIYIRPVKKHPKGLLVAVADNKVLYAGDSPYTYGDGVNWHPYTAFKFDIHPFRQPGISLVELLVPLQRRYNAIDSLIILNRMTMAVGQWLIPHGCQVPSGFITGKPGLNIPYVPGIGGTKPEKVPGTDLAVSVYKEKQEVLEAMHMIAGDNEVMSGLRPTGVNTAAGLQILLEQSYSKYSSLTQSWEKFIEKGQVKKMNLIRRKYKEPRPELVKRLQAMNKENLEVEIDDLFTGEALGDNIDVRVEAGSSLPRSKVVEQDQLQTLASNGLLGPITPSEDPIANKEFLRKFGIVNFPTPTDVDVQRAKWENSLLRQSKFDQVEVTNFDDHMIHWKVLTDDMKKPEFAFRNKQEVVSAYVKHKLTHEVKMSPEQLKMLNIPPPSDEELLAHGLEPPPPEPIQENIPAGPVGLPQGIPGGQTPPPPPEGPAGIDVAL